MKYLSSFTSPLGHLSLVAKDDILVELRFASASQSLKNPLLKEAEKQLQAYFKGKIRKFDLPYKINGSDFQKQVLTAASQIEYGHTISYGELAKKIGKPNSAQAVGQALASNSLPIIIPCHRIIAKNGLGGYNGSLWRKSFLLNFEKINS
ncbi:MAG: methylated-DNA-[protein]-cysteine S-methyltransferase [Candidatus Cloacimonadota bacterium]|jgi:methylated-DNA-[protein]-cysteine S-methyltransferase|nr:methylated-DNA-[protein]-cysteine S-methyltransferase [Candidatus Cloacimonadota bacterium]